MAFLPALAAVFGMKVGAFVFSTLTLAGSIAYQVREARKMRKRMKDAAEARKGFEFVVEGEAVDVPIVYGYAKIGGVRVFHGVSSIFEYVDPLTDKTFDAGVEQGELHFVTLREYDPQLEEWVETTEEVLSHESSLLNHRIEGSKNEFLMFQQVLCQGPINACHEVIIDNGRFLDDPTLGKADYKKNKFNKIRAAFRADVFFGKGEQVDPLMSANFGERHSAKFTDLAYASVYVRLDRDEPQFSGGVPEVQFLIEGKLVRKVVNGVLQSTRVFSNNPAWCLLDYLLSQPDLTVESCFGLSPDLIDLSSFEEAAAICDRVVMNNVKVGGKFWQPTDDSRSVSSRDLPLYECNIVLDPRQPFRENVMKLLDTMGNAHLRWSQGKYRLFLRYPLSNDDIPELLYLTDDDLVDSAEVLISQPSMSDKFNNCTVRFHDANMEFRENSVSWPPKKNTTNFRGIGGFRYPPAPSTEWSGELTKIMPTYAVWSGSMGTTTMTWKFVAYVSGMYELNFAAKDSATITISGPGLNFTDTVSGNTILKTTGMGQALAVYTVTITAEAGNEDKGVAAFIRHTTLNTQVWSTREPAYTDFEIQERTNTVYTTMMEHDNGVELETDIFYDGCTDYYHAMAKAEEVVRTSRSAAGVSFSFLIKDQVPEAGDFISLSSEHLSLGQGSPLIIRVNEVSIGENGVCAIKGSRFDWTQLAWNVPDDEYFGPIPFYDFRVLPPFNVQYEPDPGGVYSQSSGKVTWEHPDPDSIQRYHIYVLSAADIVNGVANWRELGTSINFDYHLPMLNPERTYMFGVRALGLNGGMSAMATTGDTGFEVFDPSELPVDIELTLIVEGNIAGIIVAWALEDNAALMGRKIEIIRAESADYETNPINLGEFEGSFHLDAHTEHGIEYFYWIRLVNHHRSGDTHGEWVGPESAYRLTSDIDLSVPPPPIGFDGIAFFDRVAVWWHPATYHNHAYTEVWRSETNDLQTAGAIGISPGDSYTDFPGENKTVYYWARFVSTAGVKGPFNSPNGLELTTGRLVERILDDLEAEIRESHLHNELLTPIKLIDKPGDGLLARMDVLDGRLDDLNLELLGIPEFDPEENIVKGTIRRFDGGIYIAKEDLEAPVTPPDEDEENWEYIGQYGSLGELLTGTALILKEQGVQLNTTAYELSLLRAQIEHEDDGLIALAERVSGAEVSVSELQSVAQDFVTLKAEFEHEETGLGSKASISELNSAVAGEAETRAMWLKQLFVSGKSEGMMHDISFSLYDTENLLDYWDLEGSGVWTVVDEPPKYIQCTTSVNSRILQKALLPGERIPITYGEVFSVSYTGWRDSTSADVRVQFLMLDENLAILPHGLIPGPAVTTVGTWEDVSGTITVSQPGAKWAVPLMRVNTTGATVTGRFRRPQISRGDTAASILKVKADVTSLSAQFTVKTNVNGMIAGFGLHNDGATSSFGVIADRFWIGSASNNGTDSPSTANIPFIVQTNSGAWGPPGVYMRNAFIQNASIDRAKILTADIWQLNILDAIQSINFVHNTSGWQIKRDGDFQLSQGLIRNNVTVGNRTVSALNTDLSNTIISANRIDSFRYANSPAGQTWIDGTKIAADSAFVGTLFIENNAVVLPTSGSSSGSSVNIPTSKVQILTVPYFVPTLPVGGNATLLGILSCTLYNGGGTNRTIRAWTSISDQFNNSWGSTAVAAELGQSKPLTQAAVVSVPGNRWYYITVELEAIGGSKLLSYSCQLSIMGAKR